MTLADQIALMRDGRIVQCAPPRALYNHPADQFGGWFLGNPGMVFFPGAITRDGAGAALSASLLSVPAPVEGAVLPAREVTIGIRPEHIARAPPVPLDGGVEAQLVRKTIQIGGQYLLALEAPGLEERGFKAKVSPSAGERLPVSGAVHVALPLERITLFDGEGDRIAATLLTAALAARR